MSMGLQEKKFYFQEVLVWQDAEYGQRKRKLMRGNTISEEIYQINCKFDGQLPAEAPAKEKTEDKKE